MGFLLAMVALSFGRSVTVMFVILIAVLIIAELFSGVSKPIYYRRGV